MKKAVNFNFISILIISITLLISAAAMYSSILSSQNDLTHTKTAIERIRDQDEIGDVEGYGLLLSYTAYGLGSAAVALGKLVCIVILIMAVFLFIPNLLARLIYSASGGRLLAYRIIMGFEYISVLLIALLGISLFGSIWWLKILCGGYCLVITVIGCINTYTSRIKK